MKTKEQEMFRVIWARYLPVIALKLKQMIRTGQAVHIGMHPSDFHRSGKKRNIGHQFSLELKDGRLMNDISKLAAAKELREAMREDPQVGSLLHGGHFLFQLDGGFVFTIRHAQPVQAEAAH